MRRNERRQLQLVCNHYHTRIMRCMMLMMFFSVLLFGGGLFAIYLVLEGWTEQLIPLILIRQRFDQVSLVLATLTPLVFAILWNSGWWLTYHTVGPLERITLALQHAIDTQNYERIRIRKDDRISGLVAGINTLLSGKASAKPKKTSP